MILCQLGSYDRAGRAPARYRLFPVPKGDGGARLVYDLSSLTPFMTIRWCRLPSVKRALELAAAGFIYGINPHPCAAFYSIQRVGEGSIVSPPAVRP